MAHPGRIVAVGAGGAIGATLRQAFIALFPRDWGVFPIVTFLENVIGAFLLGIVLAALLRAPPRLARWRPFLATGVLGSFTTFSTVTAQIVDLARGGEAIVAVSYIILSVVVGVSAAMGGIAIGTGLMGRGALR